MLVTMQETTSEMNKMKRYSSVPPTSSMLKLSRGDHLQERIRNWLSPPDSSKIHNIARTVHYGGTFTWFTKRSIFEGWKTNSSLLYIHGKNAYISDIPSLTTTDDLPGSDFIVGSGKSILWYVLRHSNCPTC